MMPSIRTSDLARWCRNIGLLFVLSSVCFLADGAALAQSAGNSQQDLMRACNSQASAQSLSGDKRKSFMSDCLSGKTAQATPGLNSQQQKMKACNAQATTKSLTGDARSKFMSDCLKG